MLEPNVVTLPVKKATHRTCLLCGVIITQYQAEHSKIDCKCPRCGKTNIDDFISLIKTKSNYV